WELLRPLVEEVVEGLVVELDGLVEGLQLVAADRAGGLVVEALAQRILLEVHEALDGLDGLLPLLGLAEEIELLLQERVVVGPELEGLGQGGKGLLRIGQLLAVDLRDLV